MLTKQQKEILDLTAIVFDIRSNQLNLESSPDTVDCWDSIKHMMLILALEEKYNIEFDSEEIVDLYTLGLIIDRIVEKLS